MTLEQARKICEEIIKKYGLESHSDYHEGRKGDSVLIYLTLKFKVDKNSLDRKVSK
jgi:hypothetical protein